MKIKNPSKLKEEIIRDEGVVYAIYKDHLGYPTFGIGHLVKDSDPEFGQPVDTPVSEERVDEVWEHDYAEHVEECGKLYPDLESYPDEVQRVLVNMTFNMGMTRLSKFKNFKAQSKEMIGNKLQLKEEILDGITKLLIVLND